MRALTRLSVATLLLGLSGCAADPPADMARETPPVHVPAGYDSAVATPLIVLLHGYTLSGEGQDAYMGLSDLVDDYGFLMAAPDGTKENGPDENRFWNASRSCCNFFESEVDDSTYLADLIDSIKGDYNVDDTRVFLVGHSNGGFMSYRMAHDHSDTIAAIASLAGADQSEGRPTPDDPVHVLQIHGTADTVISYEGGVFRGGAPHPGARESVEAWAAHNGCATTGVDTGTFDLDGGLDGAETVVTRYASGCRPGGSAELWTITDGSHAPDLSEHFSRRVVEWLLAHPKRSAGTAGGAAPPSGDITMTPVTVGDLTFDVRMAGPADGEVVILLHGFPQTSYEWRNQISALGEAGFRAVAPNQRGYSAGARPATIQDYAVPRLVEDIVGLADAVGAERFHIVGHDWGAIIAWAVAVAAPARVISASPVSVPHPDAFARVLGDPTSCQPEASSYFDVFVQPDSEDNFVANDNAGLRGFFAGIEEDAVEDYVQVLGSKAALGAALNWYRANIADRQVSGPAMGVVRVPTMFTWSDGDTALCIDGAELTEEYVDAPYRFEVIEGVSHWIPDLATDQMTELLLDHINTYSER
ncbi:MAG: alpha/beta fold hydrolase [Acidobacteriota bacterium]|nr:alpha/beta fold hydrolase [Acidobacteriota bacterium]